MCHVILLFSNRELPLVDLAGEVWLGIEPLPLRCQSDRAHFPDMPFAYCALSHEGCGCGFYSDPRYPDDDEDYDRESRRALSVYLAAQYAREGSGLRVGLFGTWEGDEGPPEQRIDVSVADIALLSEPVPQRGYALVRP